MKTRNVIKWTILTLFSIQPFLDYAQEGEPQLFNVHQEHVLPGWETQYDSAMKNMVTEMESSEINTKWITISTENGLVYYFQPINSMADLDKSFYDEMREKMGSNKFNSLLNAFAGSYGEISNFLVVQMPELSYQPDDLNQLQKGELYRNITYYYPKRGSSGEFYEKATAIKELFEKKKSKLHYHVYRSGFGVQDSYYMVSVGAKDVADYSLKVAEMSEALGDEFSNLLTDIRRLCEKVVVEHAYVRPQMSYRF